MTKILLSQTKQNQHEFSFSEIKKHQDSPDDRFGRSITQDNRKIEDLTPPMRIENEAADLLNQSDNLFQTPVTAGRTNTAVYQSRLDSKWLQLNQQASTDTRYNNKNTPLISSQGLPSTMMSPPVKQNSANRTLSRISQHAVLSAAAMSNVATSEIGQFSRPGTALSGIPIGTQIRSMSTNTGVIPSELHNLSSLNNTALLQSTLNQPKVPLDRQPLNQLVQIDLQVQFEKYKRKPNDWALPLYDMKVVDTSFGAMGRAYGKSDGKHSVKKKYRQRDPREVVYVSKVL